MAKPVVGRTQSAGSRSRKGARPDDSVSALLRSSWLWGLVLLGAIALVYWPAGQGGFIWDDDEYVTNNALLQSWDGLRRIWFTQESPSQYFPLTYTVFFIERWFWGLNAGGYHWLNILLHGGNALLVWRLLQRLAVPGAWLGAALFALHPVQVETVAWVTELKSVMSLSWMLLALLGWVEYVEDSQKHRRWYWWAIICYTLGLLSKTTACTLPAALVLILWLKGKPLGWRRWMGILPFVALGIGMGLVTVWWERYHQGTQGREFSMGLLERVLVAGRAVWFYLGKLIWPADLMFSYPRWKIDPSDPLEYGWLAGLVVLAGVIYGLRRRLGRGPEVGMIYYVATLSPLLGLIMLYTFRYTFVADHYQYAACVGPLGLVGAGWAVGLRKRPELRAVMGGTLVLLLGILSWRQCGMYHDQETLWLTTLKKNPTSWMAYDNLAMYYFQQGKKTDAIAAWRKSLDLRPDDEGTRLNLGGAFLQSRQIDQAQEQYQKALAINPTNEMICNNLGYTFAAQQRFDEAVKYYRQAIQLKPDFVSPYYNLGNALAAEGQWNQAIESYRKALQLQSNHVPSHVHLGMALEHEGRRDEARQEFQAALRLKPGDPEALQQLRTLE